LVKRGLDKKSGRVVPGWESGVLVPDWEGWEIIFIGLGRMVNCHIRRALNSERMVWDLWWVRHAEMRRYSIRPAKQVMAP